MQSGNKRRVYVNEVATRDGFQIEPNFVPTEEKIRLLDLLSGTGVAKIEVTSFTSPMAIPNLRDAEEVMKRVERVNGVIYTVLVPNVRGCERAISCRVDEINLVMSAGETHNLANLHMSSEQSLAQFAEIVRETKGSPVAINALISTAFGCPFDGPVPEERIFYIVERCIEIGITGLTLCDTTGMADPAQVFALCDRVRARFPKVNFTVHFHDTRGMGLVNVVAALEAGIEHLDASLGGLGGCPFAPGSSGNICTEDTVHMLERMGYKTGVDLDRLLEIARGLPAIVGHEVPGHVMKAGKADRKYPPPKWLEVGKDKAKA
ncbi:MAG: hydroxymethylglutaryl-CoA lyase [Syntrophobacteraceae bacterium]